jgi:hypothetical protein
MLKIIIVIGIVAVVATWLYLIYILVRLHRLTNKAYKELYNEPDIEYTEEVIQREFGPCPETNKKIYDRQLEAEVAMHPKLQQMRTASTSK